MRACVLSWGGADAARGWRGPSGGAGPAGVVGTLPSTVTSLAASRGSAALDVSGRVFTWGFNDSRGGGDAFVRGRFSGAIEASGQLGRALPAGAAPAAARQTPATVALDEPAVAVASGRYHTLAAGASGRVFSWGLNDHGQLGRAVRSLAPGGDGAGGAGLRCREGPACADGTPRTARLLRPPRLPAVVAVAAGRYFSIALTAEGAVYAWGRCACGRPASPPVGGYPADAERGYPAGGRLETRPYRIQAAPHPSRSRSRSPTP